MNQEPAKKRGRKPLSKNDETVTVAFTVRKTQFQLLEARAICEEKNMSKLFRELLDSEFLRGQYMTAGEP